MHIRKATLQDKRELTRLIKEFKSSDQYLSEIQRKIRAFKNLDKMAEETAEKYVSEPKYIVFVADEDGKLKGYVYGEVKKKEYRVYNKEGYIEEWFVGEESQDQKIGKKLLERLMEEFKKVGCTHVGLDTNLENTKAIQIYEHMGFTKRLVTFFKPLQNLP